MDQAISDTTLRARRRRHIATVAAAALVLASTAWGINRAVRPSVNASEVLIATVRMGDIANTINGAGVVIPVHEELVTAPVPTRVARVHAKPGQQVAKDELLLELDNRVIVLAMDGLKEQLAQQENRVLGLTLEMQQKHKQLVSSIELLELDLRAAKDKWERYQALRASGAVSGENMLLAETAVKRGEILLRQQKEQIDDNRRSTASSIDGARLQKTILQKQLEQQARLLEQTQVRAPFAGILSSVLSEEGASVAAGQMVAKVSELNNFRVEASLSDLHARSLAAGQAVWIEQGGTRLNGTVQTVLPEIQNGTLKLIVTLEQPHHAILRDKLRVDVNIVTDQKKGVLVVDSGPAFNGRGRQNLFLLQDGAARQSVIEAGASDGKLVEIVGGAKAGDRLIVSDVKRFKDRDTLRVVN